ncbi:hypothetical protein R6Z07F_010104 [Ovis aries]
MIPGSQRKCVRNKLPRPKTIWYRCSPRVDPPGGREASLFALKLYNCGMKSFHFYENFQRHQGLEKGQACYLTPTSKHSHVGTHGPVFSSRYSTKKYMLNLSPDLTLAPAIRSRFSNGSAHLQ